MDDTPEMVQESQMECQNSITNYFPNSNPKPTVSNCNANPLLNNEAISKAPVRQLTLSRTGAIQDVFQVQPLNKVNIIRYHFTPL